MAGGMLGLRTVTLDNHEVFLLARWNIHNFKVTILSLINYHHPSQKYWREINGIGHGRLTDQVRKLINEGIQTSGQGSCPGTTAPWTSTLMLALPQLFSISLVPGTKKIIPIYSATESDHVSAPQLLHAQLRDHSTRSILQCSNWLSLVTLCATSVA